MSQVSPYSKHQQCLLCESRDLKKLSGYEKTFLVTCRDCGFVFTERIPTEQELIAHYSTYGRNDYLSPITVKRYEELLAVLEPYKKTGNILDVGCGIGHFLEIARDKGWSVHGTEFTDEAVDICRNKGIQMQKGPLDPSLYDEGFFDVITSFEVIEHIYNPLEELQCFNRILRTGGAVYVTTPNFNSISRRYLKEEWSVIEYPEHLGYFTASTLTRAFRKAGFKKKWIRTTGVSISRLQSTVEKRERQRTGEKRREYKPLVGEDTPEERLRKKLESNRLLQGAKSTANAVLNITRLGDSMKGLFEKSE